MPKYSNFENWPVSLKPLPIKQKWSEYQPPVVERGYMCNFWHFGRWPSFMPKYNNFENRHVSRKLLLRVKISSISTPEVEMVYMCNFWNFGKWPSWFSSRASRPMGLVSIYTRSNLNYLFYPWFCHVNYNNGIRLNRIIHIITRFFSFFYGWFHCNYKALIRINTDTCIDYRHQDLQGKSRWQLQLCMYGTLIHVVIAFTGALNRHDGCALNWWLPHTELTTIIVLITWLIFNMSQKSGEHRSFV